MKIKICYPLFGILFLSCASAILASAQTHTGFDNDYYSSAIDLYEKGQYTDAQAQFQKAAQINTNEILQIDIASYLTLCAIKLQRNDSEAMVMHLGETIINNPKLNYIHFSLARQLCSTEQYKKAIVWFEKTDDRELEPNDRLECLYLQAYAYFKTNNFDKALALFTHVKILPTNEYTAPATYYYAHIEYLRKNYLSAITAFNEIKSDSRFSSLIAFYVLQIHAYQQEYDKIITNGISLIKTVDDARYPEIAYLIANAYFKTQQYEESLHYLNLYRNKTKKMTRDDHYLEASLYYRLKKYPEALQALDSVLSIGADSLAQNALYYAGDIALKTGNSKKALEYFNAAGKIDFDYAIKDISMFNAAKLSLELYNDTDPIYIYHKTNPQNDVSRILAIAYTIDKRYSKAIEVILEMPKRTDKDYADIQRIAFVQAMTSFDSTSYDNAIKLFDYSLTYSKYDSYLAALARYWKAEALYKNREYRKAMKQYEDFIHSEGAFNNKTEFQLAHYNIGYCAFNMKEYDTAISWFRKFVALAEVDTKYLGDAYNCIGECYFTQKKYAFAVDNYDKTIQLKAEHVDYAMYQKAMAMGLSSKLQQKLEILNRLSVDFPQSDYTPMGIYEIGRTYVLLNKFDMASKSFITITQYYPTHPYCQLALIELGLINSNTRNFKTAIDYYRKAVLFNPNSQETQNALLGLKNAYLETNSIESYYTFVDQLSINDNVDETEREQEKQDGRFNQAERIYLSGECDEAIKTFRDFLQMYPTTTYASQANFYLGDCLFRKRQYNEAKNHFSYVIAQLRGDFTELAMLGYARCVYRLEDYNDVIKSYEKLLALTQEEPYKLEATCRMMEAYFNIDNYRQAIEMAQNALRFSTITEQERLKALLIRAKSSQQIGHTEEALLFYKQLSDNFIKTPEGAEAAFLAIDILYQSNRNDDAINAIFAFSEAQSRQPYWLARSFIILGDIYVAKNEIERAKATYNSLLEGYTIENDGIIDVVKTRLAAIQ
ncbi:MAG: tetratricopeptide repeat protein [Prevotellaceae bacterium]|jgi:tetratricopeptide (TPR) repeat protein|nr:tetratricopeptide repeat protein [Prevotellaceae bacterium]